MTPIIELLKEVIKRDATDLHLSVGTPPTVRILGRLTPLPDEIALTAEDTEAAFLELATSEQRARIRTDKELDFSYDLLGAPESQMARFRINAYYQSNHLSIALRLIPNKIRTIEELNLPAVVAEFAKAEQGFVLVVGPSGHGKSSVLAAIVEIINQTREDHIITIEDPIEYLFKQAKAIINQREVGRDTNSFERAIRSSLREDADVTMVGEMRDLLSMRAALTTAETGRLVLTTLHTNTAAQTIDRIIDSFPPEQHNQVRMQLAGTLTGVLSRRLIPALDGSFTSAAEILFTNSAVRNLIREGKTHQLNLVIETSGAEGMVSLNRSLVQRVREKKISPEQALSYSLNPEELKNSL